MADYTEYYEFALKLAAEAGDLIRAGNFNSISQAGFAINLISAFILLLKLIV